MVTTVISSLADSNVLNSGKTEKMTGKEDASALYFLQLSTSTLLLPLPNTL